MMTAARTRPVASTASGAIAGGSVTTRNMSEVRKASAYWRDSGVWSRSWMTIGMSVTVRETVSPIRATSASGSTSVSASASRSRRICVSSLRA